jgi:predicted  nucleic acid-binding Zn-ribbon protein
MEGNEMNHSGDANKMVSDTPRTDEAYFKKGATMYDLAGEMKRMERELNAANERIKRLEEAGDVLAQRADQLGLWPMAIEGWTKAKEAKP